MGEGDAGGDGVREARKEDLEEGADHVGLSEQNRNPRLPTSLYISRLPMRRSGLQV